MVPGGEEELTAFCLDYGLLGILLQRALSVDCWPRLWDSRYPAVRRFFRLGDGWDWSTVTEEDGSELHVVEGSILQPLDSQLKVRSPMGRLLAARG